MPNPEPIVWFQPDAKSTTTATVCGHADRRYKWVMDLRLPLARALLALAAIVASLTATPVRAWSNAGHMASGAIAHDRLAGTDPAALHAVMAIMAHHPDAPRFARNLGNSAGPERERLLFEWMARWPDDIRPTRWSHPEWHYQARLASGWTWLPYEAGEAASAFDLNLAIARDPAKPAADRAIALCWVFHLTGDIQQPLHAGHRMSWRFYTTDRLGTIAWVRPNAGDRPIELHQYWDHAAEDPRLDDSAGAADLASRAQALRLPADRSATLAPHARFAEWMTESRVLADREAYRGATLNAGRDRGRAPVLGAQANVRARALATLRIATAGDRLASLLKGLR